MIGLIVTLLLGTAFAQAAPPPAAGQPKATPPCPVSDDETYGYTVENPIQIGGGALYIRARETRYLNALRGPEGQAIRHNRTGTVRQSPDDVTILDVYEVTYDGLKEPVRLYLDAYHFWEQRAPKGFTCVQPIQLPPMLDGFRATAGMRALAREQGRTRSFAPIPLDPAGSAERGMILDAFRTLALAASAAGGEAATREAESNIGTVVVAHPVTCEERTAMPTAVAIVPARGQAVPRTGDLLKGDGIERLLPGMRAPAGALAAAFPLEHPRPGDRIHIVYDGPACAEGLTEVLLPVAFTPARGVVMPQAVLPEGADPAQTRLLMQAVIDTAGAFTQAEYVGGPAHLKAAAMEALTSWRAEPARVNGAPIPSSTLLEVRFK